MLGLLSLLYLLVTTVTSQVCGPAGECGVDQVCATPIGPCVPRCTFNDNCSNPSRFCLPVPFVNSPLKACSAQVCLGDNQCLNLADKPCESAICGAGQLCYKVSCNTTGLVCSPELGIGCFPCTTDTNCTQTTGKPFCVRGQCVADRCQAVNCPFDFSNPCKIPTCNSTTGNCVNLTCEQINATCDVLGRGCVRNSPTSMTPAPTVASPPPPPQGCRTNQTCPAATPFCVYGGCRSNCTSDQDCTVTSTRPSCVQGFCYASRCSLTFCHGVTFLNPCQNEVCDPNTGSCVKLTCEQQGGQCGGRSTGCVLPPQACTTTQDCFHTPGKICLNGTCQANLCTNQSNCCNNDFGVCPQKNPLNPCAKAVCFDNGTCGFENCSLCIDANRCNECTTDSDCPFNSCRETICNNGSCVIGPNCFDMNLTCGGAFECSPCTVDIQCVDVRNPCQIGNCTANGCVFTACSALGLQCNISGIGCQPISITPQPTPQPTEAPTSAPKPQATQTPTSAPTRQPTPQPSSSSPQTPQPSSSSPPTRRPTGRPSIKSPPRTGRPTTVPTDEIIVDEPLGNGTRSPATLVLIVILLVLVVFGVVYLYTTIQRRRRRNPAH